jgi:hypothetical protein
MNPATAQSSVTLRDFQFFRDNAGYVVGQRAVGAIQLARAERQIDRLNWTIRWEEDPELYDCDGDQCGHYHEVYGCILEDRNGHQLASLWGIADPDGNERRVVEAELAAEAIASGYATQPVRNERLIDALTFILYTDGSPELSLSVSTHDELMAAFDKAAV